MTLKSLLPVTALMLLAACGSSTPLATPQAGETPNSPAPPACDPPDGAGILGAGTECRQWVSAATAPPDSLSPADYSFTTQTTSVPMRDGQMLSGTLYLPTGLAEPGPCVLFPEGYAPPSAVGPVTGATATVTLTDMAQRGYGGAYIYLRGTAPADEGLYFKYREDVYDIIEWMAAQPWCDGNVGTIGASLNGITQWVGSLDLPPSLKAMIPEIACGDCYWYLWNKGGTFPGNGREGRTPPVTAYDEYAAGSAHPDYDAWWQERNTDTAHHQALAAAGVSVMQCGGWDDYIFAGGVRAIEEIEQAGGNGMQLIGPCAHGGATPTMTPYGLDTWRVLWFDRFLKGIDNGVDSGPDALFYVEGAGLYRFEDEWPIPDERRARLYLRAAASGTAGSLNDGSLSAAQPASGESSAAYSYSPSGPHNNAGGGTTRPTADQAADEAISLTWTSDPLPAHTEVTGWPSLSFWASTDASDTDFIVEVTEVTPAGGSQTISRGWLNATRHFDRSNPVALTPGTIYRFDMELWPLSHVFAAGNRIRLDLFGSDDPGTRPHPQAASVTIYQDAAHPSHLELPIIGTAQLPGE